MARRQKPAEPAPFRPIEVDVRLAPNFRPIYVGGGTQTAAPVAATVEKPATGKEED